MEPRFINSYTASKQIVREFKHKMIRPLATAIPAAVLGILMIAVGLYAREGEKILTGALLIVLGATIVIVTEWDASRTWKMMCEQANGKPIEATITFSNEKAVNESHGMEGRIELNYADIRKVKRSKNLIILVTKARLGHMLRRDSFTLGTEEEFMEFIKERMALAALPKDK